MQNCLMHFAVDIVFDCKRNACQPIYSEKSYLALQVKLPFASARFFTFFSFFMPEILLRFCYLNANL